MMEETEGAKGSLDALLAHSSAEGRSVAASHASEGIQDTSNGNCCSAGRGASELTWYQSSH